MIHEKQIQVNQRGSAILTTLILALAILLLSGSVARLTKMQYEVSQLQNHTSNHYDLAEAGVELFVNHLNQLVAANQSEMIKTLEVGIKEKLFKEDSSIHTVALNERYVKFDEDKGFYISREWITLLYLNQIYEVILEEYFIRSGTKPYYLYKAKPILYRTGEIYIRITPYINGGGISLPSSLKEKEVIDYGYLKSVKALNHYTEEGIKKDYESLLKSQDKLTYKNIMGIEVSVYTLNEKGEKEGEEVLAATIGTCDIEELDYKILEKYEWLSQTGELVDSGLTCFSDLRIENGGRLEVIGDTRVGGKVMVSNSSLLSQEMGSLYVVEEVYLEGAGSALGQIIIADNIVARHVAIRNSSENRVENKHIEVGGNIFVEDSISIEKAIEDSSIRAHGVMIGISDSLLKSGIFNKGGRETLIEMKGAYVAGQAFIDYEDGTGSHRLYESIGEPYTNLLHYEEYQEENGFTDRYIEEEKEFIKKDKIRITESDMIYAPSYVSAIVEEEPQTTQYTNLLLPHQDKAIKVFYEGGGGVKLSQLTRCVEDEKYDYMIEDPKAYYSGEASLIGKAGMYHRNYKEMPHKRAQGIATYMMASRGVFIDQLMEFSKIEGERTILELEDRIHLEQLEKIKEEAKDSLEIMIVEPNRIGGRWQTIDLSQIDNEEVKIIIATGPIKLTTSDAKNNAFKGLVVALEDVSVSGTVKLIGSLVVGGKVQIAGDENQLQIIHDQEVLVGRPFKNKKIERYILDLLGFIHLEYPDIEDLFNPSMSQATERIHYTLPQLKVLDEIELMTYKMPLKMSIQSLKAKRK